MRDNNIDKPWLVWNPSHEYPRHRHADANQAVKESERLARLHPGQRFFVMKAVGCSLVEAPKVYKAYEDDGVPF